MKICIVTGSRADWGPLEWPLLHLRADPFFDVDVLSVVGCDLAAAHKLAMEMIHKDCMLVLGDRFEILGAVTAAHLRRIPVAHIGGGDVTEGSYDDAMRDCISRMASVHFATSVKSAARLAARGYGNIHMVGSPGVDYILHAGWKQARPYEDPYVVVSYQVETIDGTNEIESLVRSLPKCKRIYILPNDDVGSGKLRENIARIARPNDVVCFEASHPAFLNMLAYCEEFIGNSSAILYEAPFIEVKTRLVGKRQRGREVPFGDGYASERIVAALKKL